MSKSPSLNLNKQEYLQSHIVSSFIHWLNQPEKIAIIRDQADNYDRENDHCFEDTYHRFIEWRKYIVNAATSYRVCTEILKWGGSPIVWGNQKHIDALQDEHRLHDHLMKAKEVLNKDTISHDELKGFRFSSGFTKIYTCLSDNFLMYDSRVSAAFCRLVLLFLIDQKRTSLPAEFVFTYGMGMGSSSNNRNPHLLDYPNYSAYSKIKFKRLYENTQLGLHSNIKFNWIISNLAQHPQFNCWTDKGIPEKMFRLQTGLFMLGSDVNHADCPIMIFLGHNTIVCELPQIECYRRSD